MITEGGFIKTSYQVGVLLYGICVPEYDKKRKFIYSHCEAISPLRGAGKCLENCAETLKNLVETFKTC